MNYKNELCVTSDSDSEYESESTDSEYDYEIDDEVNKLRKLIETIDSSIQSLETQMISIQRPIEDLHIDQLGDIPFLQSSPFRQTALKFKQDIGIGLDISIRHTFSYICTKLRTYLFTHKCVQDDGTIQLPPSLQSVFGLKTPITYIELLGHLHTIVR